MLKTHLTNLPIIPEQFELNHFQEVDYSKLHAKMKSIQEKFINGLIRHYKPKNLIEIGVARGGTTVNLLNAISDIHDSFLVSIDKLNRYYDNGWVSIGSDVETAFQNVPFDKWKLITGSDPSNVLDVLSLRYDFAVIDTEHRHPVETLNFLCLLPFLNDGAIVVLHDVALHLRVNRVDCYATRVLMSSVVAPKLTHRYENEIQNIVAFQVVTDTRKYIDNVFDSLFLRWSWQPADVDDIEAVRNLLKKYYSNDQMVKFEQAYEQNFLLDQIKVFGSEDICENKKVWQGAVKRNNNIIFYGAGRNMKFIIKYFAVLDIPFEYTIWDANSIYFRDISGHPISEPDFETRIDKSVSLIITILNKDIANKVKLQFESLGYRVFMSLADFLKG
ncbi:MAG: class I SAM-dependent methyltransferase [Clostridiales bacterium]|jgi:predicted O-methyltransferase YrrM|nr:class I SAM-dependent methyltransferase [Clostridiales bacterium]